MKTVISTPIEGLFLISPFCSEDARGSFVKTFNKVAFEKERFATNFQESYYSQSQKGVIRGMHFQRPPHEHEKLVYVTDGEIIDVVLDLRKNSSTFGKAYSTILKAFGNVVYIPKGLAHGFLTLSAKATVVYNVTTVYNPEADMGIRWNSFNFDWGITNPVVSDRDNAFPLFNTFSSPF